MGARCKFVVEIDVEGVAMAVIEVIHVAVS
jgi:hypothetical protein